MRKGRNESGDGNRKAGKKEQRGGGESRKLRPCVRHSLDYDTGTTQKFS